MGICRDCEHWMEPETNPYFVQDDEALWGLCEISWSKGGRPIEPNAKFVALDNESYQADLHTRWDFGCNQFEQRREGAR